MFALALAELRGNRRRFVAPALAVAIAVAFMTVAFGATATMKSYMTAAVAERATLSDVVVTAVKDDDYLPASTAATVAAVPGVRHAEPLYAGSLQVQWPDGADFTTAASVPAEPSLRWMTIVSGRLPSASDEIAVDTSTVSDLGLRIGDTYQLSPRSGAPQAVRVVGVADLGRSYALGGSRNILGTPAAVASWTGDRPGEIDVLAANGTDPAALRDRIRSALDGSAVARTGPEEATAAAASLTGDIDVLGFFLLAFAAVALVVSALVIGNTFTALLAARLRSLALLRCVGATRRQVFRSVLVETGTVGVVASAVGVAAGAGLTVGGVAALGHYVESMDGISASFAPWMLVVSFLAGLVIALVAALVPARRATRVAPLAAMRPADAATARRASRIRQATGAVAFVVGTAGLVAGATTTSTSAALALGMTGGVVSLIGVLLLGPVLVPALARVLGAAGSRWLPARLAVGNAVRNPVRASSTSVALLVGVSLVTMMSVGASSVTAAGTHAINGQAPLDIIVHAPEGGSLPADLADRLARVPGTVKVVPVRGAKVPLPGQRPSGTRGGKPSSSSATLEVVGVDPAALAAVWRGDDPGLQEGSMFVSGADASRLHLRDGDRLTLGTGTPFVERVRSSDLNVTMMSDRDLARVAPRTSLDMLLVRAAEDVAASTYRTSVREQVKSVQGAQVDGAITQRAMLADWMDIALRVVIGLLAAALLIAVVGIANTLTLSILERSRELAMQRALGMTRRQLRLSLSVEALILSAVGAVLGLVLGIGYGWAGVRAILGGVVSDIPLSVRWGQVLGMTVLVMLTGVLAAVFPTRRAARQSPKQALGAE